MPINSLQQREGNCMETFNPKSPSIVIILSVNALLIAMFEIVYAYVFRWLPFESSVEKEWITLGLVFIANYAIFFVVAKAWLKKHTFTVGFYLALILFLLLFFNKGIVVLMWGLLALFTCGVRFD
jgi:hypothetical protein